MSTILGASWSEYLADWDSLILNDGPNNPWNLTTGAEEIISSMMKSLSNDFSIDNGIATHRSATIESGAIIKSPAIISSGAFVAATAYLRGGVLLSEGCIVGPCCEVKTTFMMPHSKIAHLSFVGDSIVGRHANIEAGAILANYRNERADKQIKVLVDEEIVDTKVDKFGTLVGDRVKIGANAVTAPGTILKPDVCVVRGSYTDQTP